MRGEFCLHLGFGLQHRPLPRGRVRIPTFAASDRVADVCAKYAAHAGSDDDADSSADGVAVGAPDTGAVVFTVLLARCQFMPQRSRKTSK